MLTPEETQAIKEPRVGDRWDAAGWMVEIISIDSQRAVFYDPAGRNTATVAGLILFLQDESATLIRRGPAPERKP